MTIKARRKFLTKSLSKTVDSGMGENGHREGEGDTHREYEINIEAHRNKRRGKRKSRRVLKCVVINAQSLQNKMSELRADEFKNRNYHIISVSETWGKENIPDSVYALDGYTMYRRDRLGKIGGGTVLYVKEGIEQRVCRPLNAPGYDSSAWCWILEKGGKKILVGSIYRSGNDPAENDKLLLEKINEAGELAGDNRILILGDFNVPNINWEEGDLGRGASKLEGNFLKVVTDNFLCQHVKVDTRFRNTQSSRLDLIFTRENNDVININLQMPAGRSDHSVVEADFICEWKSKVVQKPRRMYRKGDFTKIIEGLNRVDWKVEFEGKTVQESWDIFKKILIDLIEKYVPMATPKDFNEPWMNTPIMRLCKNKYHAWKRYLETKSYERYQEYRKEANKLKSKIRQAKRCYEKKLAKEARHNKRAFFRYVNSKLTVRPEITEIQTGSNGGLTDKDKEICDILGGYFSSVHTAHGDDEMPEMEEQYEREIRNISITKECIQDRLEKLNGNKSCGPDNMHPYVLKNTAGAICIPLEIIFNMSLRNGECPDDWRRANVTPIHKKGDKTEPGNYRPVSLTSQVCKVLESIVREHIVEHLETNNILSNKQHGFREGRSCLTNLLELVESWTEILDEGNGIDVAYLDFRKAFDLVSHKHLIFKLEKYGIKNEILAWIASFLNQRSQRVVVRGTASEAFEVTSGVPQGSVLGPVLFLIFINDLPLGIISLLSLFADDTKVFRRIVTDRSGQVQTSDRDREILQNDLDNIYKWAEKWKMEFNVDKCKVMHLGRSNPGHTYTMGGRNLGVVTEEKDLGVWFDNQLDFGKHIRSIVGRANRMLGLIKISFDCMDREMFRNLYLVMIRPILEYCVQVWCPYKQKDIDLIEQVQERATRMVPGLKGMTYDERLKKLGIIRLVERRFRGDMIETHKIMSGREGVKREDFFQAAEERGDPSLARGKKIFKKRSNGLIRQNTFSQRVVNPWNKLSKGEVITETTSGFKSKFDGREKDTRRQVREENSGRGRLYKRLYEQW